MGILNATPDSFYEGSRTQSLNHAVERAGRMWELGADFIDIGGYSTRPGAEVVQEAEEHQRVIPLVRSLKDAFPDIRISVDTFRASVAEAAVEAGAAMINDVSGGTLDHKMFETVARLGVPYVLTHMRGTPQTMTGLTEYKDLGADIIRDLSAKLQQLRELGVHDVLIDPGFGFAKTAAQGFYLLKNLHIFKVLKCPLLVGVSRKSMIWRTLGITPEESLNGTTVLHTVALMHGAHVLRVHDAKEAAEAIRLLAALNEQ
ncbi:MAG: dihydropteroate synthase [Cryomorphaceae bacterium]|nr:MAG: dihydropteroate synthase [Cryomorphaceae bacterium]